MRKWWIVSFVAIGLWMSTHASAQELRSYEAPSSQDQLDLDVTAMPDGQGAIFVASLTDPSLEPAIIISIDGERVMVGRTRQRLVVPPGIYEVTAGTGVVGQRARTTVEVEAGETSLVEPFFTAVRVQAVDRSGQPQRLNYTLSKDEALIGAWETSRDKRLAESQVYFVPTGSLTIGLGTGVDENASSVTVPATGGDLLNYRLIVDRDRIHRAELATEDVDYEPSIWRFQWVIGADGAFDQTTGRIGSFNGTSLRIGLFTEAEFGINTGNHVAQLNLELDESWVGFESDYGPSFPFQKVNDEASAELLYNYRLGGILGPYIRGLGSTSFFGTEVEFESDYEVVQQETGEVEQLTPGDSLELADSFAPTFLQQGAGLSISTLERPKVNLLIRGGVAARQSFFRGARYVVGAREDRLELISLQDSQLFGIETTALARFRPTNALQFDTTLEIFMPREQLTGGDDIRPVYGLSGLMNLRITNAASLIYRFSLTRQDTQIDGPQIFQGLALRLQHSFF